MIRSTDTLRTPETATRSRITRAYPGIHPGESSGRSSGRTAPDVPACSRRGAGLVADLPRGAGPRGLHGGRRAGAPVAVAGQRAHRRARAGAGRHADRPHPPARPGHPRRARSSPGTPARSSPAVGSARSAVGAAAGLDEGRLTLLTTPCVGAAFLPGPLARLAAGAPGRARSPCSRTAAPTSSGGSWTTAWRSPCCRRSPRRPRPACSERILWREPVCALVPAAHPLASPAGPRSLRDLVREPAGGARCLRRRGARGRRPARPARGGGASATATADSPATVAALVRAGVGVGVLTGGRRARCTTSTARPSLLPLAEPGMVRRGRRLLVRRPAGHRAGPASCSARSWPPRRPPGRCPLRGRHTRSVTSSPRYGRRVPPVRGSMSAGPVRE